MTRSQAMTFVATLLTLVGTAFAQTPTQTPRPSVNRLENLRPLDDRDGLDLSRRTSIENMPPEFRVSSKAEKRARITDEEKEQYRYAKRNGVKILKMFIAPNCAEKLVVDVSDARCAENYDYLPISYYSFFDGLHGQLFGELRLSENGLVAGRGLFLQGMLADLGEVELNNLDKKNPEVLKLAEFAPAKTTTAAEKQRGDLEKGFEIDSLQVSSRRKIVARHTYLLRIIAYGEPGLGISQYNYDSLYAVRIEHVTSENMAIILWKKISEKTAPRLRSDS